MKIICIDSNDTFFVKADTTLLRNGEPFFEPDFGTHTEQRSGVAVRITRIVKCIEERFAHRAWDEWFRCTEHIRHGVSEQIGRNFDRSFEVDPEVFSKDKLSDSTCQTFDRAISFVSRYTSLRIGDFIFITD